MAGNAGGHIDGIVKDRIQYENPNDYYYLKLDRDTGKIIDGQVTPDQYKGIEKMAKYWFYFAY